MRVHPTGLGSFGARYTIRWSRATLRGFRTAVIVGAPLSARGLGYFAGYGLGVSREEIRTETLSAMRIFASLVAVELPVGNCRGGKWPATMFREPTSIVMAAGFYSVPWPTGRNVIEPDSWNLGQEP
jgi:hypothetical protein